MNGVSAGAASDRGRTRLPNTLDSIIFGRKPIAPHPNYGDISAGCLWYERMTDTVHSAEQTVRWARPHDFRSIRKRNRDVTVNDSDPEFD